MDNFNNNFAARMSDGRAITDYSPNCELNGQLQKNLSSIQYRDFLTNNADKIMRDMNMKNKQEYGCNECSGNVPVLPKYEQTCYSNGYCEIKTKNKKGIGLY